MMSAPDTGYRPATIISSWRENMILVRDEVSGRKFGFELPAVKDYRGQTAEELGLEVGKVVRIKTDGGVVTSVEL